MCILNQTDVIALVKKSINTIETFLLSCASSSDSTEIKRGELISYWIMDFIRMLKNEKAVKTFRRYARGDIVKVHLGFRIGSEEGGLHYAVVISRNDSIKNPVLTIIPLTSLKSTAHPSNLHPDSVYLGNDIFAKLSAKSSKQPSPLVAKEMQRMKIYSVALVNQIVTISKLRIYDPIKNTDALSGISLSSNLLDEIDKKVISLFTKP